MPTVLYTVTYAEPIIIKDAHLKGTENWGRTPPEESFVELTS